MPTLKADSRCLRKIVADCYLPKAATWRIRHPQRQSNALEVGGIVLIGGGQAFLLLPNWNASASRRVPAALTVGADAVWVIFRLVRGSLYLYDNKPGE